MFIVIFLKGLVYFERLIMDFFKKLKEKFFF